MNRARNSDQANGVATIVDESLAGYDEIWAAGGVPQAVFPITYPELVRITDSRVHDVT